MSSPNQFALLKQRRFAPFFWTMFLGAFNDNIYKNALVILVAFQGLQLFGLGSTELVNLAGAIFIAPYILLSATAGQFADKFEKSSLIRRIKLLEIGLMVIGAAGFYFHNVSLLFLMLFGLGCQSALFGPVKYSFMPQHLSDAELTGGNGLVETGMYVAILGGTLLGGILMADHANGAMFVALVTLSCAVIGYLCSRSIPMSPADAPQLKINLNLFSETLHNWQMIKGNRTLRLAILGNSWFWFYGAIILAQIPSYTQKILHGNETVTTILLAVFSVELARVHYCAKSCRGGVLKLDLCPLARLV